MSDEHASEHQIRRRDFLKFATLVGASLAADTFLEACVGVAPGTPGGKVDNRDSTPTPKPTDKPRPTGTPTPSPTPTQTPTETPTPTPEIKVNLCTPETFLNKEYYIPEEALFDTTYYNALKKNLTTPFDPDKILRKPFHNPGDCVAYAIVVPPDYQPLTLPNFDPNHKETWPFQRYLTGCDGRPK